MSGGYLLLEDGVRFDGDLVGHPGEITGEVVFNTAMTGYQEAVTDPSYAGQIIVFTYPLIGNYGVNEAAMESDAAQARGVVLRDAKNRTDAASAGSPDVTGPQPRAHETPAPRLPALLARFTPAPPPSPACRRSNPSAPGTRRR